MTTLYADRRILVLGLGSSGEASARKLSEWGARVTVSEGASTPDIEARAESLRGSGIEVQTGGHHFDLLEPDLVVASPGIPPSSPVILELLARGAGIVSEIEIAWQFAKCSVVAITGTNGKTTTTSLVAHLLQRPGRRVEAVGNIGTPFIEVADELGPDDIAVVEVSSFQLHHIRDLRPDVAVLLNIAEDHTDWHGSVGSYIEAKARLFENQTPDDLAILNADDREVAQLGERVHGRITWFSGGEPHPDGIGVVDGQIVWKGADIAPVEGLTLPGRAGLENSLAAAAVALELGIAPDACATGLATFKPLPHRVEVIARSEGVTYIDDSKATNPHATVAAVVGLNDVVLIAGGRSKGIDLSPLIGTVPPVVAVVALGEAAAEVERIFQGVVPIARAASMSEAVALAQQKAVSGGSVLLSPGCASLDMYNSYVERGLDFRKVVSALLAVKGGAAGGQQR